MRRARPEILAKLAEMGLSRKASGSKEYWAAYRREYQRLPDVKSELNATRRARAEAQRSSCYETTRATFKSYKHGYNPLTIEQLACALEILKGKSNLAIAQDLNKTLKCVKYHVRYVLAKSKIKTRYEFIAKWRSGDLPAKIQRQLPTVEGLARLIEQEARVKAKREEPAIKGEFALPAGRSA